MINMVVADEYGVHIQLPRPGDGIAGMQRATGVQQKPFTLSFNDYRRWAFVT